MKLRSLPVAYTYDDLLLVPAHSEVIPDQVDVQTTLCPGITLPSPILSAAMDTVSESAMGIALARVGGLAILHKNMSIEEQARQVRLVKEADPTGSRPALDGKGRLLVGAAVGANPELLERAKALVEAGADILCLDSAHGDSQNVIDKVHELRLAYPNLPIIAGNIVTAGAAKRLYEAGANVVKVGVGPGSICTTRVVSGVGVPQATAVDQVVEVAKAYGFGVIADGGIRYSGDVVKALALGANAVMLGGMLARAKEAPGEVTERDGVLYKSYRGMGSLKAMTKGSADRYFQSSKGKLVPEGVEAEVKVEGSVEEIVFQILGGLRSGMGYCGAQTLSDLEDNATFVQITNAGEIESHPHDVRMTKSAPNYEKK
ncbi:MAG: IMP dehydrogenase [Candidatus Enteromonas sp.]